ncbi:unnamed protein product, partial [Staurois parvus]
MYTDHQGTDDQCAAYDLCSPSSATYQCPSVATFQCTSMPHISVHLSCLLVSPISAISAAYQCHQCRLSVPTISAIYECCLSVSISDACQCPSVPPTSASSSVSISVTYQCSLSVPITTASLV